ncbi:MAG TPA: DUF503 domain-containing protein [Chthonomonadales bacterium]|nr:DUF503 domain-containing protein [Chthonomonadales bacterium]
MRVGTLLVTLHLAEGNSLKDKRRVVKSVLETTRRRFNVSAAEVADLDKWRVATVGFACVSNDGAHCNRMLDAVLDHLDRVPEVEVGGVDLEVL